MTGDTLNELELRAALAATLSSLSYTQGALLRLASNVQDMQAGRAPEIDFKEIVEDWEGASRTLIAAAEHVFGPDLPDEIKAVKINER